MYPCGPDRMSGDDHALDQRERIAFDQHPVGKRAAVALVGVAHDVLRVAGGVGDGAPT